MQKLFFILIIIFFSISCSNDYTPKPPGYMRIDFPKKEYTKYKTSCPYSFDYPVYARILDDKDFNTEPCWINIDFPSYNGQIHISYKPVVSDINKFSEDARTFVYKHTVKADAIEEQFYGHEEKNVYGILYDIKGNAASSLQFILTDSTHHFLRGALYFNEKPNKDSIAPVVSFIREDIVRMIESFEWK